jgi:hypothetical protein
LAPAGRLSDPADRIANVHGRFKQLVLSEDDKRALIEFLKTF